MRVNLNNTYFPKPVLSDKSDDYVDNVFQINIVDQEYDKINQKLRLTLTTDIENSTIIELINSGKVVPVFHIEQKTQREVVALSIGKKVVKEIDLYQYSTTEPIELLGLLYCRESFNFNNYKALNEAYSLFGENISYDRGDILGFSNELSIKLPEDKRIGSIFNVVKDVDGLLKGQVFNISLYGELIQILVDPDIHTKYVETYNKDQYVKKIMFASLVYPAVVTAYSEMFNSYALYKDKKWCQTLSSKIEKVKMVQGDEIFTSDKYDVEKVYEYVNIALGDLYRDAINVYHSSLGD